MVLELIENEYKGNGRTIQLHPNATYENFVGGLAPEQSKDALGLRFRAKAGFLMQAAAAALRLNLRHIFFTWTRSIVRTLARFWGKRFICLGTEADKLRACLTSV